METRKCEVSLLFKKDQDDNMVVHEPLALSWLWGIFSLVNPVINL